MARSILKILGAAVVGIFALGILAFVGVGYEFSRNDEQESVVYSASCGALSIPLVVVYTHRGEAGDALAYELRTDKQGVEKFLYHSDFSYTYVAPLDRYTEKSTFERQSVKSDAQGMGGTLLINVIMKGKEYTDAEFTEVAKCLQANKQGIDTALSTLTSSAAYQGFLRQYPSLSYETAYYHPYRLGGVAYVPTPVIISVTPTAAEPGDSVTLHGTGFESESNGIALGGVYSVGRAPGIENGTSITFMVPITTSPGQTVKVTVMNSQAEISNSIPLKILTVSQGSAADTATIDPTSLHILVATTRRMISGTATAAYINISVNGDSPISYVPENERWSIPIFNSLSVGSYPVVVTARDGRVLASGTLVISP